jgi:hypothetical protein
LQEHHIEIFAMYSYHNKRNETSPRARRSDVIKALKDFFSGKNGSIGIYEMICVMCWLFTQRFLPPNEEELVNKMLNTFSKDMQIMDAYCNASRAMIFEKSGNSFGLNITVPVQ